MNRFANVLIDWYKDREVKLPWKLTRDPYRIWISEVILQQTRVAQGYAYYERFVNRFPDVVSLAEAAEDEVMKLWQGLGYYSRARNLHAAARSIVLQGGFPTAYKDVLALKGVGEYTAAAICSFAYDMPYAVLDGNVYRVLARWIGIDLPIDTTEGKKAFRHAADEMLDKGRPADYNQAIMDFGEAVCTPVSPRCDTCPLAYGCAALAQGKVNEWPAKARKTKVTHRFMYYIYVRMGDETLLRKRTGDDIWKNLYEPLLIETEEDISDNDSAFFHKLQDVFGKTTFSSEENIVFVEGKHSFLKCIRRNVKHVLTHRIIHAGFFELQLPADTPLPEGYFKVKEKDLQKYAVSNLVSQFFSLLLSPDKQ